MQNIHSSIDLEHRLTVVEICQDEHKQVLGEHHQDLKDIRSTMITPRDIRMMIAGVLTIVGALAGKVPWSEALSLLSRP